MRIIPLCRTEQEGEQIQYGIEKKEVLIKRSKPPKKKAQSVATSFKGKHEMNGTLTLVIAIIGALGGLASLKMIVDYCRPCTIVGKMISRYDAVNKNKTQTLMLFKLSVLCKNKPFNLRQIKCQIEDEEGNMFLASAANNRYVQFPFPPLEALVEEPKASREQLEAPHRLLVSGDEFLNNSSFLPANKNVVGYLFFRFDGVLDRKFESTTFIFESFGKKTKKLELKESDIQGEQLLHDDTIWQAVGGGQN